MHHARFLILGLLLAAPLAGQRRGVPPPGNQPSAPQPDPLNTGLGPMQMYPSDAMTAAPQSLTRQLSAGEERIRQSALEALGVPAEYIQRGRIATPRSIQLQLAPLGADDEPDALLTVELEHHLVTAVLRPQRDQWQRLATVVLPAAAVQAGITPSQFVRLARSLHDPAHYRALFHARSIQPAGGYADTEASVLILNGRAVITASFIAASRDCTAPGGRGVSRCSVLRRELRAGEPGLQLVAASGTVSGRDAAALLAGDSLAEETHLRGVSCQPVAFSPATLRYQVTGPAGSCKAAR